MSVSIQHLQAIGQAAAQFVIDQTKVTRDQRELLRVVPDLMGFARDPASKVVSVQVGHTEDAKVVLAAFTAAIEANGDKVVVVENLRQLLAKKPAAELFLSGYRAYVTEVESKVYEIIEPETIQRMENEANLESTAIEPSALEKAIDAEFAKRGIDNYWVIRNAKSFMGPTLLEDQKFNAFLLQKLGKLASAATPQLAKMVVDAALHNGESLTEKFFATFVGTLANGKNLHEAAVDVFRTSGLVSAETLKLLEANDGKAASEALKSDEVFVKEAKGLVANIQAGNPDYLYYRVGQGGSPAIALLRVLGDSNR